MSRSRLHVAFYTDSSAFGGAEQVLATLVGGLGGGFEATILGVSPEIVEAISGRLPALPRHVLPPVKAPWDLRSIGAHFDCIRRLRPDVLHVQLWSPWAGEYAITAGLAVPGVQVVSVVQSPGQPPGRWRERALVRVTERLLGAHVAPGERTARELERMISLAPGSFTVIHNGVRDVPLERGGRTSPGPVVGWTGRLALEKGVDVLVSALPELPGVTAVVVGDGPERGRLEAQAARLGVESRVVFAGWHAEPRHLLPSFDVFVLPSRVEAFPLAPLEAMLAEIPVVASDVGSVAEAVVPGETGMLVPPEDPSALARAVREVLQDEGRRRRLGRQGRALVLERFTAERMVESYEALYRCVVARRRG